MSEKILVACIGNIFLGDDGFGFEVAQALAGCSFPATTEVHDYGIRGLDLAYALLGDWKAVVLVDAIARGGVPGTVYLLQPAEIETPAAGLDPHSMDPASVLATARWLGKCDAPVYLVGCEPENPGDEPEGRLGLTPTVAAAVPEAVHMIRQLIDKFTSDQVTIAVTEGVAATGGEQ